MVDDRDERPGPGSAGLGFSTRAIHDREVPGAPDERPVSPPIWLTSDYTVRRPRALRRRHQRTSAGVRLRAVRQPDPHGAPQRPGLARRRRRRPGRSPAAWPPCTPCSPPWSGTGDHLVAQRTVYGGTYALLPHRFPALRDRDDVRGPRGRRGRATPSGRTRRPCWWRRWPTRRSGSPTWRGSRRCAPSAACRWWSTTPWPRLTCSGRSRTPASRSSLAGHDEVHRRPLGRHRRGGVGLTGPDGRGPAAGDRAGNDRGRVRGVADPPRGRRRWPCAWRDSARRPWRWPRRSTGTRRSESVGYSGLPGHPDHVRAAGAVRGPRVRRRCCRSPSRAGTRRASVSSTRCGSPGSDRRSEASRPRCATRPPPATASSRPRRGRRPGIGDGLMRVAVGGEDAEDLVADVLQGLEKA